MTTMNNDTPGGVVESTEGEKSENSTAVPPSEQSAGTAVEQPVEASTKPAELQVDTKPEEAGAEAEKTAQQAEEDDDDELDEVITLAKAKDLRAEHKTLRRTNKELEAKNEELVAKIEALETSVRDSSIKAIQAKFGFSEKQTKYLLSVPVEELEKEAAEMAETWGVTPPRDYSNLQTGTAGTKTAGILGMSEDEILAKITGKS